VEIIDIHPHVISTDQKRYPFAPISGKLSHWVEERPVTTEEMLAQMDAAGIAKSVLVHASTAYGYDNSYAADSAAAHPDRFTSVCCVDVRAADAPERLRYWIRDRHMTGLRIFTSGSAEADDSAWIDDPVTMPAWEAASELAIPVCLQMKATGFPHLQTILKRFPTLPVILDHLAHPPSNDGPPYRAAEEFWKLAAFPNVYLKLTAHNFKEFAEGAGSPQTFIQTCLDAFGADHIAWGSNFPSSKGPLTDLVALAQRELAFLSAADRRAIFHDTGASLYPAVATANVTAL
jgi:L-fuconolactonase